MNTLVICGLLAVIALALAVHDKQPTECYSCSPFAGVNCSSFVLSETSIQSCDNITTSSNTTDKVVCFTYTANLYGFPITERGCTYQEVNGKDFCNYMKDDLAPVYMFIEDYECNLCYDDLCNNESIPYPDPYHPDTLNVV